MRLKIDTAKQKKKKKKKKKKCKKIPQEVQKRNQFCLQHAKDSRRASVITDDMKDMSFDGIVPEAGSRTLALLCLPQIHQTHVSPSLRCGTGAIFNKQQKCVSARTCSEFPTTKLGGILYHYYIGYCQFSEVHSTYRSRHSSGLGALCSGVRVRAEAGNFSLQHRVQTGSGAHPASYLMGTKGSFPGGKAAEG
jgi:hypothetical protein